MRKTIQLAGSSALLASMSACQTVSDIQTKIDPDPNGNSIRNIDLSANSDLASKESTSPKKTGDSDSPISEILSYGDQAFYKATAIDGTPELQADDSLPTENFVFRKAPIDAVINEILGETYNLSYTLDPQVRGQISLRLESIATPEQAIAGLNAALNLQGIEITKSADNYVISRQGKQRNSTSAPVFLGANEPLPPGASLAVLQIQYASVDDVTNMARSMLPKDIIKFSDDTRGFIVLSGDPQEVSAAVSLLKSLDVNWLNSVSSALIPIRNASPSEIASDLAPIIERLGGVSVVPLDRLQTLMVLSRRRESLDQAREWIARLDLDARPQVLKDILVYEARYVNAEDLLQLTDSRTDTSYQDQRFSGPQGGFPSQGQYPNGQEAPYSASTYNNEPDSLYANLSIRVDPGRNAIVARGATDELKSLSELLSLLDKPKRQVLIEATIVEVSLSDKSSLGVQWNAVSEHLSATFSDTSSGVVSSLFPGASVSYINKDISAVVNALATTSDTEIVSSPRMLVLNNETAKLQIGDQVPIITQSAVSITDPGAPVVNSTSYRDTGVILSVKPKVRAGGMVEVTIAQEVSGVSETTTSSIDSPTISQRSLESVLAVPDGSTAILGGLMSSTRTYSQSGIPILKDIPILGAAFRSTGETDRRTELVILVEPTVVSTADPVLDIPTTLRNALLRARSLSSDATS